MVLAYFFARNNGLKRETAQYKHRHNAEAWDEQLTCCLKCNSASDLLSRADIDLFSNLIASRS